MSCTNTSCTKLTSLTEPQQRTLASLRIVAGNAARHCEHVKSNGEFCGSPALRGRNYCYFHLTGLGRRLRAARSAAAPNSTPLKERSVELDLPPLENANSIQIAIGQVIDAILQNRIDTKRAGLVLYALQTASSNLDRGAQPEVSEGATVAGRYDAFEEDFELDEETSPLKAEEISPEEEEEAAVTAKVRSLAEAIDRIEEAKQDRRIRPFLRTLDDENQTQVFECDPMDGLFCSIMGDHAPAPVVTSSNEREVRSQRLVIPPAGRKGNNHSRAAARKRRAA